MSTTESKQLESTEERSEEMASMTPELERKAKEAAMTFLERCGYTVLEHAMTCHAGTIDIIAQDGEGGPLVFANVKAALQEWPADVDPDEMRRLFEAAAPMWLAEHHDIVDVSMRCDVIYLNVISRDRAMIKHHVDAIGHVEPTFQEKFFRKASEKTGIDESALADRLTIATV